MRIVLDTNVFVSALLSRNGPPARVLAAAKRREHTLVTSRFQIAELQSVLGRDRLRPYLKAEEVYGLLSTIEAAAVVVSELPMVELSSDPDDNGILATAIAGDADIIVSGDKRHMIVLRHAEGIPILTPREALDRLEE